MFKNTSDFSMKICKLVLKCTQFINIVILEIIMMDDFTLKRVIHFTIN